MADVKNEGRETAAVGVDVYCTQEKVVIGRYNGRKGTLTVPKFRAGYKAATDEYRFPQAAGARDHTRTLMKDSQALCPKCRGALMLVPTGGDPKKDGVYLVPDQIKLQEPEPEKATEPEKAEEPKQEG